MRNSCLALLAILIFTHSGPVSARFLAPASASNSPALEARLKSGELRIVKRYRNFDVQILAPANKSDLPRLRAEAQAGSLRLGLADRPVQLAAIPNDPGLTDNPFYQPAVPDADTHLAAAWDRVTDASGVVVAVMDTGMDFTHPDLAPNVWLNPAEANGLPGVDDDGNGFIDDISGYDFVTSSTTFGDSEGHGTRVAGMLGARGDNGIGIVNTTWSVDLLPIRIFSATTTTLERILDGFDYCLGLGQVDVINASFGFLNDPGSPTDAAEIESLRAVAIALRNAGILLVGAAGNEGVDIDAFGYYPGSLSIEFDNVISVAAIGVDGAIADFGAGMGSNFGNIVSVAAPGQSVLTTILGAPQYGFVQGTSFATPFVCGAAALAIALKPSLTPRELKYYIVSTSRDTAALAPTPMGGGLIDLDAMLDASFNGFSQARNAWTIYD